jgi:glucosamine 6-phosphate synthetase-like amidotransferase/phosphosugar isomerase protein
MAATRAEVYTQPEVISRVLGEQRDQLEEVAQSLAARQVHQVLASGSGDSWFAAQAVRLAWEQYAGVSFEAYQAYEYAAYGRPQVNEQTAHFVISSSGRPTTTWDALDRALKTPALVIGVTDKDSPDNPFLTRPPVALVPGAVKVGWPTQTTTATMAVLLKLAIVFGRVRGHLDEGESTRLTQTLDALPAQMAKVLEMSDGWAEGLAITLGDNHLYTFVGGGPSYAVGQTGAALLAEGPQEFGLALTVEEFHHALRVATLNQGDPVILIAPAGASESRCRDTAHSVREWGARLIALVTPGTSDLLDGKKPGILLPEVEEPLSPMLTLLPLQALSIALAEQKVARGYQRPEGVP